MVFFSGKLLWCPSNTMEQSPQKSLLRKTQDPGWPLLQFANIRKTLKEPWLLLLVTGRWFWGLHPFCGYEEFKGTFRISIWNLNSNICSIIWKSNKISSIMPDAENGRCDILPPLEGVTYSYHAQISWIVFRIINGPGVGTCLPNARRAHGGAE